MKSLLLTLVLALGLGHSESTFAKSFNEFSKSGLTHDECEVLSSVYRTIGYQAKIQPYVSICEKTFSHHNIDYFRVNVKIPSSSNPQAGSLSYGYTPNLRRHRVRIEFIEDYLEFLGFDNFKVDYLMCGASWPCFMSPSSVFESSHGVKISWID